MDVREEREKDGEMDEEEKEEEEEEEVVCERVKWTY